MGMLEKAFTLFREHKQKDSNNDITFGCLIDACVKNGQIEKAEGIFHEILSEGAILPNTVIYTTMIKAYSRIFNLQKALEIYYIMISP
jgi:pentatricopeptide repeat protein